MPTNDLAAVAVVVIVLLIDALRQKFDR